MQITVLGSGGALPTHRRGSSGYLVEWSGGALLLDAAAGTLRRALAAGLDLGALGAVALSHFHPDHSADLPAILFALRQLGERAPPLEVFGPDGTADLLDRFRRVYGRWLETPHRVRDYPGAVKGLELLAFPARHSQEAVCLRLEADGRVLAYSGDTALCDGLIEACHGADLALLECCGPDPVEGHLSLADVDEVIHRAQPREVLLTHLPPRLETSLPLAEDGLVVPL